MRRRLSANKTSLLAQIEETLARNSANVTVNLINIAQIFAKLDERLAGIETKLDKLLAEHPPLDLPGARAEQLIALLDQRIKAAFEREQRALCEATCDVVRGALREFVDELKRELELKLKQVETLLATRPPLDPPPRPN
jgi:hypothetical protein